MLKTILALPNVQLHENLDQWPFTPKGFTLILFQPGAGLGGLPNGSISYINNLATILFT